MIVKMGCAKKAHCESPAQLSTHTPHIFHTRLWKGQNEGLVFVRHQPGIQRRNAPVGRIHLLPASRFPLPAASPRARRSLCLAWTPSCLWPRILETSALRHHESCAFLSSPSCRLCCAIAAISIAKSETASGPLVCIVLV